MFFVFMSNFTGLFLLIIGPSGVGKGTTIDILKKRNPDWVFPISATTRLPRPGEKEGETYHYFTEEEFLQKIDKNEFIEWAWVHQKFRYGTLKSEIITPLEEGYTVLREVDIQGFECIKNIIPSENLVSIFFLPPSEDVLIKRIQKRAPITEEELERRKKSMKKELALSKDCDYQIVTKDGNSEYAVGEVEKIVEERLENKRFL